MIGYNAGLILVLLIVLFSLLLFYIGRRAKKRLSGKSVGSYIDGIRSLVVGDRSQAVLHLTKAAQEDTENIDAYLLLGDILREEKKASEAIKIHRSLLSRLELKKEDLLRIYRSLAMDYLALSMWDEALRSLNRALELRKETWIYKLLQRVHEARGNFDEAYRCLEKAGRVTGEKDVQRLALYKVEQGRRLIEAGGYHEARILFKEAIKLFPKCLPAYLYIGDAYSKEDRLEEAIEWWHKLANEFPNYSHLVFDRLESAYFKKGEFGAMIQFYEGLLERSPGNDRVLLALVRIYDKMGDYEKAIEVIKDSGAKLDLGMKMRLAKLYAESGKSNQEIADWFDSFAGDVLHEERVYECETCGYKSAEPLWYCPQCKSWQSFGFV
ncbi:tetratricopeptide repeat protein [bacterium]|nr:tetratricopeptide repeat protein [bacterium]